MIDWQSMELCKADRNWIAPPATMNPFEAVVPGTINEADPALLDVARRIVEKIDELREDAISLMKSLRKDQAGWHFEGIEILRETDSWGAKYILSFSFEDYVGTYVGFRDDQPLYVLQRIE